MFCMGKSQMGWYGESKRLVVMFVEPDHPPITLHRDNSFLYTASIVEVLFMTFIYNNVLGNFVCN